MNWFMKQMYKHGTGSPGDTAKTVAESLVRMKNSGFDRVEACEFMLENYINTFVNMGVMTRFDKPTNLSDYVNGDPAILTLIIIRLSLRNKPPALMSMATDIELIVEIILEIQNEILNEEKKLDSIINKARVINNLL